MTQYGCDVNTRRTPNQSHVINHKLQNCKRLANITAVRLAAPSRVINGGYNLGINKREWTMFLGYDG